MRKRRAEISYRPGTLGYTLQVRGYAPVPQLEGYPLWQKEGDKPVSGHQALLAVYREIWKETHGAENGR